MTTKKSKQGDKTSNTINHVSDEDEFSFRDAIADVRPLISEERIIPVKKKPPPRPRQFESNEYNIASEVMSDPIDLRDVEINDELFFARSGIQLKVQRKLRRGEFTIEDELDLHGYTAEEAKKAIIEFIEYCKKDRKRCIRIIHGKGYRSQSKIPVLKTNVAHWLPQHSDVMAFSSARPADGGSGAIYVLLKVVR